MKVDVDPDLIRAIGSNIMQARVRAGLTVGQVAGALELAPKLLVDIEQGDQSAYGVLDLLTFLRVARYVGTQARHILLNDGTHP